jgi:Fic family protein
MAAVVATVTAPAHRRAAAASAALRQCAGDLSIGWEPLARLLLRSEGVASSQIEEVRAPLPDIAAAELDPALASPSAGWVVANLDTVLLALTSTRSPLTAEALHTWHRTLMRSGGDLDERDIGGFRDRVGWVGGATPRVAAHVGSPPERIAAAMDDLLRFVNRDDVEPTVQAALVHAQFELIHPYADGNGRLGRVLISWILARGLELRVPPPVSVLLARDRSSYVSGLTGFREIGPRHWVRYFAEVVDEAARATEGLLADVRTVLAGWEESLTDLRPMATARNAIRLLADHPVVSAELLANALAVSQRSARTALAELHERGIVEPYQAQRQRRGRPTQLWVATRLVDLVAGWGPMRGR